MNHSEESVLHKIIQFVENIGFSVVEAELGDTCFTPGISFLGTTITIDRQRLQHAGDLLHEAGHIAVTPENERKVIGTSEMEAGWPGDGNEIAANLWSYAAIQYINIPPEFVFHETAYQDDADWFIQQFQNGNYIGLPLLVWMGLCKSDAFPDMIRWLR